MDGLDISVFDEDALYLICTSTYGVGRRAGQRHASSMTRSTRSPSTWVTCATA